MDNTKTQVIEQIKQANNVLVTVSNNPSVDQLAACIGLTVLLNKLDKHATAVFSGDVPSTIEFLQPEQTLEKNTDSLRDFIISLDKSKADKLRYKVEDKMVKIFITPYKTSITDKDLIFSQGDFNVDLVIALGVMDRDQLDQAIVSHGRILHDASVVSVNTVPGSSIGTINWIDTQASSLCEMMVSVATELKKDSLDPQIATALLTGVVAETNRFSNEKTSSMTMSVSAQLMTAGANQQLVATKLQAPVFVPNANDSLPLEELHIPAELTPDKPSDGSLNIEHEEPITTEEQPPQPADSFDQSPLSSDNMFAQLQNLEPPELTPTLPEPVLEPDFQPPVPETETEPAPVVNEPPQVDLPFLGPTHAQDTSFQDPVFDANEDPLSLPPVQTPLLSHDSGPAIVPDDDEPKHDYMEPPANFQDNVLREDEVFEPVVVQPQVDQAPVPEIELPIPVMPDQFVMPQQPDLPVTPPPMQQQTNPFVSYQPGSPVQDATVIEPDSDSTGQSLADIERSVYSPHVAQTSADVTEPESEDVPNSDAARAAIDQAINAAPDSLAPIQALNAQPLGIDITHDGELVPAPEIMEPPEAPKSDFSIDPTSGEIMYPGMSQGPVDQTAAPSAPTPPPVPPPMMPPFTPQS